MTAHLAWTLENLADGMSSITSSAADEAELAKVALDRMLAVS